MPELTVIAGTSAADSPVYRWDDIGQAVEYQVWVNKLGVATPIIRETVSGNSFQPEVSPGIGSYRIWVRAVLDGGAFGAWSEVVTYTQTEKVSLTLPAAATSESRPEITWTPVAGAARYELWVNNLSTGTNKFIHDTSLTEASYTPTADLAFGNYRVWVRAFDSNNRASEWSEGGNLQISTELNVPSEPVSTFNTTPVLQWGSSAGNDSYELYLRNETTKEVTRVYDITSTSWTPDSELELGRYTWWIRAYSGRSVSAWSDAVELNVGGQAAVVETSQQQVQWNTVEGAASYRLWVDRLDQAGNIVNVSDLTSTSYNFDTQLPAGSYRVWVQAISVDGVRGAWSRAVTFTVADNTPAKEGFDVLGLDLMLASLEIQVEADEVESPAVAGKATDEAEQQLTAKTEAGETDQSTTESDEEFIALTGEEIDAIMVDWTVM